MISKYSHKELTWIDLESPSEEEILYVIEQYSIPLSVEEEIKIKNEESKIKLGNGFMFSSLYFPQILNKESKVLKDKVDFIVNNNFILTIHYNSIKALREFLKNLEVDTTLPEQLQIKHNDLLYFYLIKNLYINIKEQLFLNDNQIKEIENTIINKSNKHIPLHLYKKNQILIDTEQIINSHEKILETMSNYLIQIFGEKFQSYSVAIIEEFTEIKLIIASQNKNIDNLYNLNSLILTNKNTNKLKLLIILSVISLIAVIATSLYVINNI